jgi:glycosyltransferase involved in cell wall biosynthesis
MIDLQSINESLDYDPNIILYLGHLSHAKGYCDVLEIIPEIANLFPEVKFCFAGTFIHQERNVLRNSIDGTLIHPKNSNDLYKKLIKDKLEHNYQYLGMISGAEKDYWISRCNFMILPSYSEGFSMAVLEGLAHAKPIITTPVGALKDIITHGENGFLQNPGDKNSLRDNIIELLSDKRLRDSFALNNQKKRLDFSIQKIEMEYINLFKSLL